MTEQRSNRRDLIRLGGAVTLAVVAGGSGLMAASAADTNERAILGFRVGLTLERLQVSYYSAAGQRPYLTGELAEFVRVVSGHERAHVAMLQNLLGPAGAAPEPKLDLTDALADARSFTKAAVAVEDLGVAAYDGQIPRLSRAGLAAYEPRSSRSRRGMRHGSGTSPALSRRRMQRTRRSRRRAWPAQLEQAVIHIEDTS